MRLKSVNRKGVRRASLATASCKHVSRLQQVNKNMAQSNKTIDELLTPSYLRSSAGSRSYSRGEEYFENGAVHHLYCDGVQLSGDVSGTRLYRTSITVAEGKLAGRCTCPVLRAGGFCKHLVALGLTYLKANKKTETNKSAFNWQNFLHGCEPEELVKIILEMSPNNTEVIERYRMANLPAEGSAKLKELKSKIDELYALAEMLEEDDDDYDSYDDYDCEAVFYRQQSLFLKVLSQLAAKHEMQLLWDISTYSLDKFMDASTAEHPDVQEFAEKMMSFFTKAANAKVKSNDEIFRVFSEWEKKAVNFGFDVLSAAFNKLSKPVKELWVAKALEKWRAFSPRKLGEYGYNSERKYIEHHLLSWADEHKDDSLKLKILEKSLASSSDVMALAQEYRRQNMIDKIIPLLQKATKTFRDSRDILDLLTEELRKAGKGQQALELAWTDFTENYMSDYQLNRLYKIAAQLKRQDEYYQKALAFLEKLEQKQAKSKSKKHYYSENLRQRRVELLFNHGDKCAAWELTLGAELSEECWLKLADWRANTIPEDAAAILKKLVEKALGPTGAYAYAEVVKYLKLYGKYMEQAGKTAEFASYCSSIRTEYKRRRLLLEQMNRAKL